MKTLKPTLFFLILLMFAASRSPTAAADVTVFYPDDDCYTQITAPNNNHDGPALTACSASAPGQPVRYNFLMKFDISALAGKTINSAKFRIVNYASSGSLPMYIRKIADDTWLENTITWNTMPARGDIVYTGACGEAAGWREHESVLIADYVDEEKGGLLSVWYGAVGTNYAGHYNFYRSKEYDGGSVIPELVVNWSEPVEFPTVFFGAGFNASSPYVELHWEWDHEPRDFFEVQNSSDGVTWTYLGQSTTENYTDSAVIKGTQRFYRVRACNDTGAGWDNSTFSDVNFEEVYFIMSGAPGFNVSSEWVTHNLTSIDVLIGTHDSGDVNSTLDIDGDTFNCSEVAGAPGYRIGFNWTGVDDAADCLWVVSYVFYDGNQAHDIHIELWNFTSLAWVEIGTINDGVDFSWENVTVYGLRIPNDFVNSTGAVLGRFDHVTAGNINHDVHVEYLKLLMEIPAGPAVGAVTVVETDPAPWIAIAIILMCVAYLLTRQR